MDSSFRQVVDVSSCLADFASYIFVSFRHEAE